MGKKYKNAMIPVMMYDLETWFLKETIEKIKFLQQISRMTKLDEIKNKSIEKTVND